MKLSQQHKKYMTVIVDADPSTKTFRVSRLPIEAWGKLESGELS